ncbi:hypothetical protein [Flavobacterium sp. WC2430]|uniref:hypothetical protein n=1 Tax=Flavobacterium sp. WC2430 TaxID=3234137 RepID=UPI0034679403
MNVSSKFRQMYWARVTIGLVVGITMSIKFLQMSIMENGRFNFEYAPFWIGILISIILIIQIISILTLQTIHVYNDKIVIKYLFFTTSKTLLYDAILNI